MTLQKHSLRCFNSSINSVKASIYNIHFLHYIHDDEEFVLQACNNQLYMTFVLLLLRLQFTVHGLSGTFLPAAPAFGANATCAHKLLLLLLRNTSSPACLGTCRVTTNQHRRSASLYTGHHLWGTSIGISGGTSHGSASTSTSHGTMPCAGAGALARSLLGFLMAGSQEDT
jgi:hypothetical protein